MSVIHAEAAARLRKIGGDRLLREMIELFLQLGPGRVDTGTAGAADWEATERACHSLKSAAGNLGARELQQAAELAEEAAGERDEVAHRERAAVLRSAYEAAERELREILARLEG